MPERRLTFRGHSVAEEPPVWSSPVAVRARLRDLTLGRDLEQSRLPVAVAATDLLSGQRVVLESGNAVDGGLPLDTGVRLGSGLQALSRALGICHARHAHLLFEQADLVLRPDYREPIDILDFDRKRLAVAAGLRAVRSQRSVLARRQAPEPGPANDTSVTGGAEELRDRRRGYADGVLGDLMHGRMQDPKRESGTEPPPRLPATRHLPPAQHLETTGQHRPDGSGSRA